MRVFTHMYTTTSFLSSLFKYYCRPLSFSAVREAKYNVVPAKRNNVESSTKDWKKVVFSKSPVFCKRWRPDEWPPGTCGAEVMSLSDSGRKVFLSGSQPYEWETKANLID